MTRAIDGAQTVSWVRLVGLTGSGITCYTVVVGHRQQLGLLLTAARSAALALRKGQKEGSMSTHWLRRREDAHELSGQVGHGEDDGRLLRARRGRRHADLATSTLLSFAGGNLLGKDGAHDREGPPKDHMAPASQREGGAGSEKRARG